MTQEYIEGDMVEYLEQPVMIRRCHDEYNFDLLYDHRIQDKDIPLSKIYPIRLTDKILRKNGWYDREDFPNVYYNDTDGLSNIYLGRCCNGWSINVHGEVLASVFYVHQFQHFLLGIGFDTEMEV